MTAHYIPGITTMAETIAMIEEIRARENAAALDRAIARRIASYSDLSLGSIRADRSIPIRTRSHSVSHKAISSYS